MILSFAMLVAVVIGLLIRAGYEADAYVARVKAARQARIELDEARRESARMIRETEMRASERRVQRQDVLRSDVIRGAIAATAGRTDFDVEVRSDGYRRCVMFKAYCNGSVYQVDVAERTLVLRDPIDVGREVVRELAGMLANAPTLRDYQRGMVDNITRSVGVPQHLFRGEDFAPCMQVYYFPQGQRKAMESDPSPPVPLTLDALKEMCKDAGTDGATFTGEGGWRER